MNAHRPCSDFYATGEAEWLCDDCGLTEWSCVCDEAPADDDDNDLALAPVVRISPTQVAA